MTASRVLPCLVLLLACDASGTVLLHEDGPSGPSTAGDAPSTAGDATPPRSRAPMVFVTSEAYPGDLQMSASETTLESADRLCTMHASVAGLGGSWVAWLSSRRGNAVDRLRDLSPWRLPDGQTVAISSVDRLLLHGPDVAIDVDEYGEPLCQDCKTIWTGTNRFGVASGHDCQSWTVRQGYLTGTIGRMGVTGSSIRWTDTGTSYCFHWNRLLCIEQ